jgi:hypothetical protein
MQAAEESLPQGGIVLRRVRVVGKLGPTEVHVAKVLQVHGKVRDELSHSAVVRREPRRLADDLLDPAARPEVLRQRPRRSRALRRPSVPRFAIGPRGGPNVSGRAAGRAAIPGLVGLASSPFVSRSVVRDPIDLGREPIVVQDLVEK